MARVLIVDDDSQILSLLRLVLESNGYVVDEARHGAEALERARRSPPDLIISDLMMPVMDGYMLLRQWKSDARLKQVPFVVHTATYTESKDKQLALSLGADAFLLKPTEHAPFLACIRSVLSAHPADQPLPPNEPSNDDAGSLQRHSEILIGKLEQKTRQLEQANRELEQDIAQRRLIEEQLRTQTAALRDSEERFRSILDSALDCIISIDHGGRIIEFNPAAEKTFGFAREQVLGKAMIELIIPEEFRERHLQGMAYFQETGEGPILGQRIEVPALRADGTEFHAELTVTVVHRNGHPEFTGFLRDITERKRVDDALRESRTLLEQAQRIAGLGAWVSGLGPSDSLWWSDQTYEIFGMTREQFDGTVRSFFEAVYPADRPLVQEASRAAVAGERPYGLEHRIVRPDGTIRWVHELAEVVRDADGQFLRMIGVVRDITAKKEQDEALLASRAMLSLVLDTIPQGVFWKDRNSAYLGANRVSRQAMGVDSRASLVGLTDFDLPALTHEQAQHFVRIDREVMSSGEPQSGIVEPMTLPDGSTIWLETSKVPLQDADGHVTGILGTWQNITERRRADEELRTSRERLAALSQQLIKAQENERRHIAHELHDEIGQALTGIKLNLNALQPSIQAETDKAVWQDTLAITNQTLEQVRNLSLDLRPSMLDDLGLAAALRWCLDRQARRAGFASQFLSESSETGVSKEVETVCFRIAQECLTNIARHAQARQVRVELHRSESDLELLVADDGVGFDVSAACERAVRGTSLGLLGMQERVRLLGGQLEMESAPSRGTRVRVRFPITQIVPKDVRSA